MLHFDKRAENLGNGGFGTVSIATTKGGSPVAVKRLNNQNIRTHLLDGMRREVEAHHALQVHIP